MHACVADAASTTPSDLSAISKARQIQASDAAQYACFKDTLAFSAATTQRSDFPPKQVPAAPARPTQTRIHATRPFAGVSVAMADYGPKELPTYAAQPCTAPQHNGRPQFLGSTLYADSYGRAAPGTAARAQDHATWVDTCHEGSGECYPQYAVTAKRIILPGELPSGTVAFEGTSTSRSVHDTKALETPNLAADARLMRSHVPNAAQWDGSTTYATAFSAGRVHTGFAPQYGEQARREVAAGETCSGAPGLGATRDSTYATAYAARPTLPSSTVRVRWRAESAAA